MQPLKQFKQDPNAKLDYSLDWGADGNGWLAAGDTIAASSWTVTSEPAGGGSLVLYSASFDDTGTTVRVRGGAVGETYQITNHITTAAGLEDDRTIEITIEEQ